MKVKVIYEDYYSQYTLEELVNNTIQRIEKEGNVIVDIKFNDYVIEEYGSEKRLTTTYILYKPIVDLPKFLPC